MKAKQTLIRSSVIAFVLLTVSALPMRAGVNRWTSLGPRSEAFVSALVADPAAPDTVYAATAGGGIFKSQDGGETWTAINSGLDDGSVTALVVDPTASGTIYAATEGSGVFKTTDGGKTWWRAAGGISDLNVTALALDPTQPSTLYAGSSGGKLYKTTDGAETWRLARPWGFWIGGLFVTAGSGSAVYVIVNGGLYRSADGENNWEQVQPRVGAFALDSRDPRTLYLSVNGYIVRTTDGGTTWKGNDSPPPFSVLAIAVSPGDPTKVLAGGYDGRLYRSDDATVTWRRFTGLADESLGVRALLASGPSVLAARGNALLKGSTESDGLPWRSVTEGLDAAGVTVTVSPADSSKLLGTDGFRPICSADGGESWSFGDVIGVSAFNSFTFSPTSSSTALAGTNNGILRTDDGGASWQTTVLDTPFYTFVHGFAFNPTSPETVYAASSGGLQKSSDGGRRWSRTISPGQLTYSVLADRLNPSVLYTVYLPDALYYGPFTLTIAKSTDAGATWKDTGFSGPSVPALVMDSADTQTIYAGTDDKGVYKTTDGAISWNPANAGIEHANVSAIAADPTNASTLYAATNRGIFRSGDAAASWFPFNDGLANLSVTALSIDSTGRHLYASTGGGGIFHREIRPAPFSCEEAEGRACYLGRFLVSASARPPSGNLPPLPVPIRQGDRFGSFRLGPADVTAPDIFVKIVDGRALPGGAFWIFHAGLTRDDYTLTVTDAATGRVRIYQNAADRPGCGGIDTLAFPDAGLSVITTAAASTLAAGDGDILSLYGGRYSISLSATDPRSGRTASGLAMPQGDRDGYFSLAGFTGDPAFPEVFVRVVEQPDGSLAFSHAGLTDLAYTLTVTNTATSAVQTYHNDLTDPLHPCGGVAAAP